MKLSIAYDTKEEEEQISKVIDSVSAKCRVKAECYITSLSNGKKVIVLEYSDEAERRAGDILESIIKTLNITKIIS
jgi:phosphoribosylamine-glycine ligase